MEWMVKIHDASDARTPLKLKLKLKLKLIVIFRLMLTLRLRLECVAVVVWRDVMRRDVPSNERSALGD